MIPSLNDSSPIHMLLPIHGWGANLGLSFPGSNVDFVDGTWIDLKRLISGMGTVHPRLGCIIDVLLCDNQVWARG